VLKAVNHTFSAGARLLHWSTALLVLGLFFLGLWMRELNYYHPWYETAPTLHIGFGIVFIGLVVVRLIWRCLHSPPALLGNNRLEHAIAFIVHALLYALMIAISITGYLYATADGKASSVFGLFHIPVIVHSKALADQSGDLHEWFSYAIIGLTALHILGALKHHVVDKDDTLRRMVSGKFRDVEIERNDHDS